MVTRHVFIVRTHLVLVDVAVATWIWPDGFEAAVDAACCVGRLPAAFPFKQGKGTCTVC
jgi:hypothetical protein